MGIDAPAVPYDRVASSAEIGNPVDTYYDGGDTPRRIEREYKIGRGQRVEWIPRRAAEVATWHGYAAAEECVEVTDRCVIYEIRPGTDKERIIAVMAPEYAGDKLKAREVIAVIAGESGYLRLDDIVTSEDIATRLSVKPATVRQWKTRHADFPRPIKEVAKSGVWSWGAVMLWAVDHGHLPRMRG